MRLSCLLFLSFISTLVSAKTHTWWYKTTWLEVNADGFPRTVIGFNDSWPLPTLRVKKGDRVEFHLINGFGTQNTTVHFHGLFQNGTNQMDGPEMVTQCPIGPGDYMLYNFTVPNQAGTYWYHSHTKGQDLDGMRGLFIIEEEDKSDYPFDFDEEVTLSVSDWYHKNSSELIPEFMNLYNPTGAEPIPQNIIFNETRNNSWAVEPNTTYYMRICNIGGFVSQYLYMEDHEFEVVAVDGVYVKPNTTSMLYITVAQRYDVLIKTKADTSKNYAFMQKFDDTMLDVIPSDLMLNGTNYIIYDEDADKPHQYKVDALDFLDDFYLEPVDGEERLEDADYTITIDVEMNNLGNGVNYAFFNNLTYTTPKVPTLATVFAAGDSASNSAVYGSNVNSFVLKENEIVDIVLNNHDTGTHPFHLHGHVFQVLERYAEVDGDEPLNYDPDNHEAWPEVPMKRDTIYVRPQSYFVIRFKADNPGVWFFHCHIQWHLIQGLAIVLVAAPESIQSNPSQALTDNYKDICKNVGIPVDANAAGNSKNILDLSGENVQHKPLPAGFTAKGIVALVFSCIAAFLGMATISYYGLQDISTIEKEMAETFSVEYNEDEQSEDLGEGDSNQPETTR